MSSSTPDPSPQSLPKLLVSACLLGNPVRYDGQSKSLDHAGLEQLLTQGRVIAFCPEVGGGLPVPRAAAEILAGDGSAVIAGTARVKTREGYDVSEYFLTGAAQALALCRQHDISTALMTELSPSCGTKSRRLPWLSTARSHRISAATVGPVCRRMYRTIESKS